MWVWLTLLSALSLATSDALTKKALRDRGVYLVGWLRLLFTLPLLVVILAGIERPPLDGTFYRAFGAALPLEILAFVLYMKALKASPLSLTIPFLSLTPVFLIGFSYVIVGESLSASGVAGILLISVGGYALNLHRFEHGVLGPFKAIFREKGSLMMIGVAVIYSITSSLGKVCINHSSPLYFGATYFIVVTVAFTPLAYRELGRLSLSKREWGLMATAGLLNAVMVVTHMLAISMTNVAYMVAVKRTSLLFSIFYGWVLFREERMRERSFGAALMFAGFVLLVTTV